MTKVTNGAIALSAAGRLLPAHAGIGAVVLIVADGFTPVDGDVLVVDFI